MVPVKQIKGLLWIGPIILIGEVAYSATKVDLFFTVQPISVCNDDGTDCAEAIVDQGFVNEIFKQAGVAPVFLPTKTINRSSFQSIKSIQDITNSSDNGRSNNRSTLNMWFVKDLEGAFGQADIFGNDSVINSTAVARINRIDTVPHEIGHNFGLTHDPLIPIGPDNLMADGGRRNSPASDLNLAQELVIRNNPFFIFDNPDFSLNLPDRLDDEVLSIDISYNDGPDFARLNRIVVDFSQLSETEFFEPAFFPDDFSVAPRIGLPMDTDPDVPQEFIDAIRIANLKFSFDLSSIFLTPGDQLHFFSEWFPTTDDQARRREVLLSTSFTFDFSYGLSTTSSFDAFGFASSTVVDSFASIAPTDTRIGDQISDGVIDAFIVPTEIEPITSIPISASMIYLISAIIVLIGVQRPLHVARITMSL